VSEREEKRAAPKKDKKGSCSCSKIEFLLSIYQVKQRSMSFVLYEIREMFWDLAKKARGERGEAIAWLVLLLSAEQIGGGLVGNQKSIDGNFHSLSALFFLRTLHICEEEGGWG
jgi:hypothetical protein